MKKICTTLVAIFAIAQFSYAQTLQDVTDNGASTTHSITVSGLDVLGNGINLGNRIIKQVRFCQKGSKGFV